MKVGVSIPDGVFAEAEDVARQLHAKRSDIYTRALRSFIADHAPERVRDALDRVVEQVGAEPDAFAQRAARGIFDRTEW